MLSITKSVAMYFKRRFYHTPILFNKFGVRIYLLIREVLFFCWFFLSITNTHTNPRPPPPPHSPQPSTHHPHTLHPKTNNHTHHHYTLHQPPHTTHTQPVWGGVVGWLRLWAGVRDTLPGEPVIGVRRNIFWSLPEEHFTFLNSILCS